MRNRPKCLSVQLLRPKIFFVFTRSQKWKKVKCIAKPLLWIILTAVQPFVCFFLTDKPTIESRNGQQSSQKSGKNQALQGEKIPKMTWLISLIWVLVNLMRFVSSSALTRLWLIWLLCQGWQPESIINMHIPPLVFLATLDECSCCEDEMMRSSWHTAGKEFMLGSQCQHHHRLILLFSQHFVGKLPKFLNWL